MIATGLLGSGRKGGVSPQTPPLPGRSSSVLSSLGLLFDPYDHTPLPTRVLVTGAAANFPSVANLVGDMFNAPVFMPHTQVDFHPDTNMKLILAGASGAGTPFCV